MHSSHMTSEGQQRACRVGDTHTHTQQVTVTQRAAFQRRRGGLTCCSCEGELAAQIALCTQAEWNANRIQFSRFSRAPARAARPEHKYHCESARHAERDVHVRKDNECSQQATRRPVSQKFKQKDGDRSVCEIDPLALVTASNLVDKPTSDGLYLSEMASN